MPRCRAIEAIDVKLTGPLPMSAITEWMLADASSSVDLEEDTCTNIQGEGLSKNDPFKGGDASVKIKRHIESSYGEMTNYEWAKKIVQELVAKNPEDYIFIAHSKVNPAYICVRKIKNKEKKG